jgi:hypothetical protein
MTESEGEAEDFSNALLAAGNAGDDVFSFEEASGTEKTGRTQASKVDEEGLSIDETKLLTSDTSTKAKLNGSSFKNMGKSSICNADRRLWADLAESYCKEGL